MLFFRKDVSGADLRPVDFGRVRMLIIQAFLSCFLLTAIVKIAVGNNAVNGAYFYPKEIQQRLIELGRTDQKTIDRKRKICMTSFYVVLPAAMLLIIGC